MTVDLQTLMESLSDGVIGMDRDGRCTFINRAAAELLGYRPDDILGQPMRRIMLPQTDDVPMPILETLPVPFSVKTLGLDECIDHEILWRRDGRVFPIAYRLSPIVENDELQGAVAVFRDNTGQHAQFEQWREQALRDVLTRLPNRARFFDALEARLRVQEWKTGTFAVLFIDLDNFKMINDTLGHDFGDQVLITVADRLRTSLRNGDLVARLGGDEFAILVDNLGNALEANELAERIDTHLRSPMMIQSYTLIVTPSLGIALPETGTETARDLIRQADAMMYAAKNKAKSRTYHQQRPHKIG